MKKTFAVTVIILFVATSFISITAVQPNLQTHAHTDFSVNTDTQIGEIQLYSSRPDTVFPELLNSVSGYIINSTSYGYVLQIKFELKYQFLVTSIINRISESIGSISYINGSNSNKFNPCLSYSTVSGHQTYYTPQNIYQAYSFGSANASNITGKGTTIVIIDAFGDPFISYDISVFDNVTGIPPVNLQIKYMNNTPNAYNQSWAIETALDVEWAHASAPSARIVLLVTPNCQGSLTDALSYAISKHLGNIISLSWGEPESELTDSQLNSENSLLLEAALENITVLAATGDQGAYDGTSSLSVNFPASDPYVLAVGGTSLDCNNGVYTQTAWGGYSSQTSYGSGGGFSSYFSVPYWQKNAVNSSQRGVPDVAADANKNTGVLLIANGQTYIAGGTSLATPIWAGVVSRVDQYLGYPVGLVSPVLYQIYNSPLYTSALTPITKGGNGYYNAGTGWNPVTGLGTPVLSGLLEAIKDLKQPYGAEAVINASYDSPYASAEISINNITSNYMNGTSFYYMSYLYNTSSYVKAGIAINSSGIFSRYSIVCGSIRYSSSNFISNLTGSISDQISIKYNGSCLVVEIGGSISKHMLMLSQFGSMRVAFGAEVINSSSNLSNIPDGTFSSIMIKNISGNNLPVNAWETHYSGLTNVTSYATINILHSGNNFLAASGETSGNGRLSGNASLKPSIVFQTIYTESITEVFSLSKPESDVLWYVNGSEQTSNSVVFSSSSYGVFNISARYIGGNVSAQIYVPRLQKTGFNVSNEFPYYHQPGIMIIDESYQLSFSYPVKAFSSYLPSGENTLELIIPGFFDLNSTFLAGKTADLSPLAEKTCVVLFVFNAVSSVSIDNTTVNGSNGTFVDLVTPGDLNVSIQAPGFIGLNRSYLVDPGSSYYYQFSLAAENRSFILSGKITDAIYNVQIAGASISSNNNTMGYTNSSGDYILYLSPGTYNLTYSANNYNSSTITITMSQNQTKDLSLFPRTVNVSAAFRVGIDFYFPIAYLSLYLSWKSPSSTGVANYLIYYSVNANMSGAGHVTVPGTSTYTVIFPVTPSAHYYVQVISMLVSGQNVPGNIREVSALALPDLLINFAIYAMIIGYIVLAAVMLRKAFGKKKRYNYE